MCWQQRVGLVGEGSGGKAGTSSCLHTLPLPSLGNFTNTHLFTKKKVTRFCLAHHLWTSLYYKSKRYCLVLRRLRLMGKYICHRLVKRPKPNNTFWTDSTSKLIPKPTGFPPTLIGNFRVGKHRSGEVLRRENFSKKLSRR